MKTNSSRPFKTAQGAFPGRSKFDLSYEKKFTCKMGQLIPVLCDEVVPGDHFHVSNAVVARFLPMVAPLLHEVNMYVHYFFVPYRILWDSWENFITGGPQGTDSSTLPLWTEEEEDDQFAKGSLWDYLGFPVNANGNPYPGVMPLDFPRRAYLKIWNDFYRDETLQAEKDIENNFNYSILNRSWEKDYFTSALPWQQRGTAPALPISGTALGSAVWDADLTAAISANAGAFGLEAWYQSVGGPPPVDTFGVSATGTPSGYGNWPYTAKVDKDDLSDNAVSVDLSGATTFNVADLRLVFQIQKFLERNARCGIRYTEFLRAHFGVSPRDDRLQRPEYIGGSFAPVIFSEVLQTSRSDEGQTPQGTMTGHGISVSKQFCGQYFAQEFGVIMGIMSIMPKPAYQQGINRQWLRRTKYDFYFPEFSQLSEQAILTGEIFASQNQGENVTPFGFQGRYDEMRYKPNMVCSDMRDTFDYWHLGREFASAPALNEEFITCVPRTNIFVDTADDNILVNFGNVIRAVRPLPITSEPGFIDHH